MIDRHPRACRAPGCPHLAPTRDPLCLRCQHGGRLPKRLGASAWRHAGELAARVILGSFDHWPHGGRRPSEEEFLIAHRRVARCYRGAAYAVADSRGLGGLAP